MKLDIYRRWKCGDILKLGVQPSETNFETRLAGIGDAAAISSVLYESFLGYQSLYTSEGFAATTPTAEQVLARMSEGPIWVVLLKRRDCGYCVCSSHAGISLHQRHGRTLHRPRKWIG